MKQQTCSGGQTQRFVSGRLTPQFVFYSKVVVALDFLSVLDRACYLC